MVPEYHYLKYGAKESRDPSPKFSTKGYLLEHPELDINELNPLLHFLQSSKD